MSRGVGRALVAGVLLAVVVLAVGGLVLAGDLVQLPVRGESADQLLVVCVVPQAEGGEAAALAFTVDAGTGTTKVLDTLEPAMVAGTSARSAREAYPYGGGAAVAGALKAQTGDEPLPWVVLPAEVWSEMVSASGGVDVTVESGISAYIDGELTVVHPGERSLEGTEAVALAASAGFLESEPVAREALAAMAEAVSKVVSSDAQILSDLVASGAAHSSLGAEQLPVW